METVYLVLHGEAADRASEKLVGDRDCRCTLHQQARRRQLHRYRGDGVTLLAYEQASAYRET